MEIIGGGTANQRQGSIPQARKLQPARALSGIVFLAWCPTKTSLTSSMGRARAGIIFCVNVSRLVSYKQELYYFFLPFLSQMTAKFLKETKVS